MARTSTSHQSNSSSAEKGIFLTGKQEGKKKKGLELGGKVAASASGIGTQ
ncbi:predicted protein [Sclerotinia sclerotiorum 1980 UF-70]|uniref:Uncharacterized protein n=1 Tax=Sclerotinia sclerotiorum (strain ATCC 18683 / 1980 / Ss-1) TaxID=665079 RepID=A7ED34_SCLS1|nr:predicted protein [Sclerotinia sclerotiorum 1980 UF-70]EDO00750.1 predicted protein [Sclerotinia sclerotiorum 1980 UF-70]